MLTPGKYPTEEDYAQTKNDMRNLETFVNSPAGTENKNSVGNDNKTLDDLKNQVLEVALGAENKIVVNSKSDLPSTVDSYPFFAEVINDDVPTNNGWYVKESESSTFVKTKSQPGFDKYKLIGSESLSTLIYDGVYGSTEQTTHSDLPADFPQNVNKVIVVQKQLDTQSGSAWYATQYLYEYDKPQFQWVRRVLSSGATTTWVTPGNRSILGVANADAANLIRPGCYVLTGTPTNLPNDWPVGKTPLASVEMFGGFKVTTLFTTSNEALRWQSINGGAWSIIKGFGLTALANFTRNYAYMGLTAQGNANDLKNEGHYMLSQPATGLPSDAPTNATALIDVEIYGSFAIQTLRYREYLSEFWQRSGTVPTTGDAVWLNWNKFTNSIQDSLKGKTIAVLGDSIVEGGNWPEQLSMATGATVHKFGFGGCRMSAYPTSIGRYDGMCGYAIATCIGTGDYTYLLDCAEAVAQPPTSDDNRPQAAALAALDWSTVDILVVAFGTNDWTRPDLDLGDGYAPDPTGMTLRGSVSHIIQSIQSTYPNIRIVFQLPSYRTFGGGVNADQDAWVERQNGISLLDVNNSIREVANRFGCPTMSMLEDGTVNAHTADYYLRDGIHPKPGLGYKLWADRVAGWLKSIC